MEKSDQELVAEYKEGNSQAFEMLVRRYSVLIFTFVSQYIGASNFQYTEDIVQEVFIKIWRQIKKFKKENGSFKTWVFAIARNTAIDWMRKKKIITFSDMNAMLGEENVIENSISDSAILADELFAKNEDTLWLEAALEKLNPSSRAIIFFHYEEELTFEAIADIVGLPMNTVKSQYRRALMKLKEMHQNAPSSRIYK